MAREHDVEKAHAVALRLDAGWDCRLQLKDLDEELGVLFARRARVLAEMGDLSEDKPSHAVMEVAGTCKVGQDKAGRMLTNGRRLVVLAPRVMELLEAGVVHLGTVELLLRATAKCTDEVLAEIDRRIASQLIDCDAADAFHLVRSTILEVEADLDPTAAERRHAQARSHRGVWVKPVEDGMARIGAEVDSVSARRFELELNELARLHGCVDDMEGSEQTAQPRRADVFVNLPGDHLALIDAVREGRADELLGLIPRPREDVSPESGGSDEVSDPLDLQVVSPPAASPAVVSAGAVSAHDADTQRLLLLSRLCRLRRNPIRLVVHTAMTTLLDLDNRAGYVEGLGPISAHQARLLRPIAALQALWSDAETGLPLGLDPTVHPPLGEPDWDDPQQVSLMAQQVQDRLRSMLRPVTIDDRAEPGRFPSAGLAELVRIRDIRCIGPGCPMPASRCEFDHLVAVAEGGLTAVWTLALKSPRCHHARHDGWASVRLETGETVWISPLGGRYVRGSPWRRPPKIRKQLPPASLDRPDGGLRRTFEDRVDDPPTAAEPDDPTSAEEAIDERPYRERFGDEMRRTRQSLEDLRNDRSGWDTDGPPPF